MVGWVVGENSNRSAALLQLNKVSKAIADAEECIRLKPDWEKGYFRKGNAYETLKKTGEVTYSKNEREREREREPQNDCTNPFFLLSLPFLRTIEANVV